MLASWRLLTGECLDVLATLEPESVDACVTDPPYGISFMGREWDTFMPAEALDRVVQTVGHSRPQRAIGAYTTPDLNDCAWTMCWCGSPSTDPFHPAIRSTIETATSWITGSRTCSWSTRPHTNGCMAAALGVMVAGGSLADSVENPSPWILSTGTSARKAGPVTDDVDRATSVKSWLTSKPGKGGGRRVGVRNSHPT